MATYPSSHRPPVETESGAFYKVAALLLGLTAGVVGIFAVLMWADARDGSDASAATPAAAVEGAGDEAADQHAAADHNTALPLASFAGVVPENAAELAEAHKPYDATLPPAPTGDVVQVQMTLKDMTVEVAPGVKYNTWAFDGHGAPGPIIHVREGQTVEMTLTNGGAIPHSIDFHAARIAPNVAFRDVAPGESIEFSFVASDPGVYMYHCGTKPVLAHIANGMYGAIVVQPKEGLPPVDNEYVLVGSEWYLNGDGIAEPASLDMGKARARMADWVTFNGYANQYVTHPLTADPGDTTRFWVVAAGPTNNVNFHVVGAMLDRAWINSDMTQFQRNVQTAVVPAGGGAVFDVTVPDEGLYPFVSHA
ncbi:MAG TPA: multicopper oxidase domain-containing protein, partial [Gaiellaceae bacterium]|nr:multicopper oxidase domain-containing protein [Gaiellaceae bacterium]